MGNSKRWKRLIGWLDCNPDATAADILKAIEDIEKGLLYVKPCPFCGGDSRVSLCKEMVQCDNCNTTTDVYDTKKEAVEAWNRRVK